LQSQIDDSDALIAKAAGEHEPCRRLMAIPGIGPLTATAVAASIGNGSEFRKGRSFAAWLGLYRSRSQLAASRSCSASASVATTTCADCL